MWISLWISVDDWMLRPQDKYLHTNCLAALANMSAQFRCLHQYAAQRIIRWGEKTQLPLSRCYWFYCNKFQVFFFWHVADFKLNLNLNLTGLYELNHCLVQTGTYNWTLICQVCFGLLYNHRLRPLLFYCKNLSQQKKKKIWGPTYIIYILYLLRGPFSPRTIVYIKDDKNAFQSDWRPSHEDIHSIIHLSLGPRPSSLHVCEKCLSTPQEMMWGMSRSFFFIYWNQQHHWCVSYLAGAYSPFINCCLMKAGCLRTIICNE